MAPPPRSRAFVESSEEEVGDEAYSSIEEDDLIDDEDNEPMTDGLPASGTGPSTREVPLSSAAPAAGGSRKSKTIEQRYQKKTQLEHILLRPETYVGSLEEEQAQMWIWSDTEQRMIFKSITYIPAMYKIFDEILVNAADVKARELHERGGNSRGQRMTRIDVEIDPENASISVSNDGAGIPIEIHKEHKVYVPELIFGHLLTSDNYDDADQRVTGGRNGYGAKLTNIFSEKFTVNVIDSTRHRHFSMTWSNNMTTHTEPRIVSTSLKSDSVKVTFRPDLKRFRADRLSPELIAIMQKRVYDIAGTTGVKVSLNGQRLPVKDFRSYVDLYFARSAAASAPVLPSSASSAAIPPSTSAVVNSNATGEPSSAPGLGSSEGSEWGEDNNSGTSGQLKKTRAVGLKSTVSTVSGVSNKIDTTTGVVKIHERINERWEVVVSQSDGSFQQVSFVNSICTTKGGTHVNAVLEPLIAAILKKVSAKNKGGIELKGHHIRNHIFVFVNCLVVNPVFDSQTKETLTLKASQFGSKYILSDKTINALVKSSITETVLLWAQTKQQVDLKRKMKSTAGGKREKILGIPKLEDAHEAGGRHAQSCILILTEGDSAKTSCLAGLSVVGRERYGVFPLRGKLLNVRDAGFKQLTENKEIQNILTITGLEVGRKIQDPKGLRYGSIMIMTDQDHDGSHIKGLLINLFQHYWPDLLKHHGFLREFVTPIVKVSRKNEKTQAFFTIPEYEEWKRGHNNGKGWKIKYYKGLGTSDDKEFKQYFSALRDHQILFNYQGEEDFEAIDMAFNARRTEDRKRWIQSFEEGTFVDHRQKTLSFKEFINKELVLFSKYDTERSIPCMVDGWKPGQRKVLWGVFKKNLQRNEMKVAQLSSYVAEVSCYHHGEESLAATIVNMAQTFVGSNNLNVLQPCGQFGSRKEGGKDASAYRYIYTKLSQTARALFHPADDELLHYNNEEGRVIEPRWFVPVIPVVLVNGAEGIGTGWSSSMPNYDPRGIIQNLRCFIRGLPMEPMVPWYRGWTGRMEATAKGFDSVGVIEKIDDSTVHITELPVRQWTQGYRDFLEDWLKFSVQEEEIAEGRARPKAAPKRAGAGRGRGRGGATGGSRGGAASSEAASKAYKFTIKDFRDSSSHETISFTVTMDPEQLILAEADGLEKVFRLRKSIPLTNMTLFSAEGQVVKYESELEILRAFARVRLDYYHRRKRHQQNILEKEKCLLSNKLKFVLQVVEGELVISKKKKADLVIELRQRGFDSMSQIQIRFQTINPTMQGDVPDDGVVREGDGEDEEEAEGPAGDPSIIAAAHDYDYLVGMPLWNLTYEKVEHLRRQQQQKEQELDEYKKITPEDLWFRDLDSLEAAIDSFEATLAADHAEDGELRRRASLQGPIGRRGAAAAQRPIRRKKDEPKVKAPEVKTEARSMLGVSVGMAPSVVQATSKEADGQDRLIRPDATATAPAPLSPARDFSLMDRLRQKMAAERAAREAGVGGGTAFTATGGTGEGGTRTGGSAGVPVQTSLHSLFAPRTTAGPAAVGGPVETESASSDAGFSGAKRSAAAITASRNRGEGAAGQPGAAALAKKPRTYFTVMSSDDSGNDAAPIVSAAKINGEEPAPAIRSRVRAAPKHQATKKTSTLVVSSDEEEEEVDSDEEESEEAEQEESEYDDDEDGDE